MGSASLKVNEPSMEEILASIRRIIADDQEVMPAPGAEETVSSPLKNVLDIAECYTSTALHPVAAAPEEDGKDDEGEVPLHDTFHEDAVISQVVSSYEREQGAPRLVTSQPVAPQPSFTSRPAASPAPVGVPEPAPAESLLSSKTKASVSSSFGRLGATLMPQEPRTLEDLMKEMLRPMLREWLDENLPSIVERLVQAEIERVARGRG